MSDIAVRVAQEVMGWQRMSWAEFHKDLRGPIDKRTTPTDYWHDKDGKPQARAEDGDDYYVEDPAWSPDTDIAAAWPVAEKLGLMVIPWNDRWVAGRNDPHPCNDIFMLLEDGDFTLDGKIYRASVAETAPLAICHAALKCID